ncbi:MAG: hypothetical protein H6713_02715 [Myxococcales bacterium]|nr:hypothetical protein [Myxococcales bacterium]
MIASAAAEMSRDVMALEGAAPGDERRATAVARRRERAGSRGLIRVTPARRSTGSRWL